MEVILRRLLSTSRMLSLWLMVKMLVLTMCSHSIRGPMAAAVDRWMEEPGALNRSAFREGLIYVGSAVDSQME